MALDNGQRTGDDILIPGADDLADELAGSLATDLTREAAELAQQEAAKQAETRAYEEAVKKAFGGKKGMADAGIPSLLFVVVYTVTKDLTPALWAAVATALALTAVRLLRRETLQHSISGVFGVLVCAAFAKYSGRPQDFYLPGLLLNLAYAGAFILSNLLRWPIVGLMLGPITGEMTSWRRVPGRARAFSNATWVLSATFVLRVVVQLPLYWAGQTTALGITRLIMGYPLYLGALYVGWQIIKNAPPPLKVEAKPEAGADADIVED